MMGVNMRNSEGYYDPTAYEALSNIEREAKAARAFRPIVYICSPLSGDMDANQEAARRYCRYAVDSGYIPIAPHIYFTQFMNEHSPKERNLALFMDIVLLSKCSELWAFGDTISKGMSMEIEKAKRKSFLEFVGDSVPRSSPMQIFQCSDFCRRDFADNVQTRMNTIFFAAENGSRTKILVGFWEAAYETFGI